MWVAGCWCCPWGASLDVTHKELGRARPLLSRTPQLNPITLSSWLELPFIQPSLQVTPPQRCKVDRAFLVFSRRFYLSGQLSTDKQSQQLVYPLLLWASLSSSVNRSCETAILSCQSWMKQNMPRSQHTLVAQRILNCLSNILIFLIWHFECLRKPCFFTSLTLKATRSKGSRMLERWSVCFKRRFSGLLKDYKN